MLRLPIRTVATSVATRNATLASSSTHAQRQPALLKRGFKLSQSRYDCVITATASSSSNMAMFSSSSWNWSDSNKTKTSSSVFDKITPSLISNSDPASSTATAETAEGKIQREILDKCSELHSSLMPMNEKLRGPLAKHSDRGTSLPFVLLVGNHSSGKSSFVNYVLGRKVQTAGVAPTDDCFTVIAPGPSDVDQDGPALVGDPDMGFANLRQFGPTLIHHTQLKVRSDIQNNNFMLVDSPGMIDSPVSAGGMSQYGGGAIMDRGYDFQGVVKWFAERADVVLLFFDPDKPGTTGETLSILLHSLGGMDHKLMIVLNKADQFRKIHDFARAYGSLCWNLSKVIPRKDLPRIFTMCLPASSTTTSSTDETGATVPPPIGSGLADLHQTRDDVVAEVMKAPKRRIDNVITHLNDSVHLLLMHARIVEDTRSRYSRMVWENRVQEGGTLATGASLTALGMYFSLPVEFTGGVVAATVLGVGGMHWYNSSKLKAHEDNLLTPEELGASFQRTHSREVSEADEFTSSVWQRIRDPLMVSLRTVGLDNTPTVGSKDIYALNQILDEDIPRLRRLASPTHFGSKVKGT
mmetsp:Transcript_14787/g.20972  ORF Transcript_14787/g.20972 Transcript_14787/m.20972 type:complete len:581 (+) Transcript_14787:216-1958(+)